MRSRRGIVAALAIAGAVLAVIVIAAHAREEGDASSEPSSPVLTAVAANAVVIRVVDGDTVDVEIGHARERLRMIGIDTPESVDPRRPVECFGHEATELTKALLPAGTAVRIERDVEPRDDYGRLLGYVRRADDGLFVNLELVARGYATPLRIEPNTTYADVIVDAANAAQRQGLGLWTACDG